MGTKRRNGQILVIMAACLPVLCILAAATVDVGHLCTTKAQLQNAADAAATASVMELWEHRMNAEAESAARTAAVAEAGEMTNLNHAGVATQVEFGKWDETSFSPADDTVSVNAVKVTASRNAAAAAGPCDTFFAHMFGIDEVEEEAVAIARFRPKGFMPFSIYEPNVVGPGQELILYDDETVTPGVFGLLDFDGGSNSTDDLIDWINEGYLALLWIDPEVGYIDISGNPGWVDAIQSAVQGHVDVGDSVVACVYSDIWGTGSGTVFRIVGFIEIVITAQGQDKNLDGTMRKWMKAMVKSKYLPGNGTTKGTMKEFMKLQLVQ
jgi:hypothetical protein